MADHDLDEGFFAIDDEHDRDEHDGDHRGSMALRSGELNLVFNQATLQPVPRPRPRVCPPPPATISERQPSSTYVRDAHLLPALPPLFFF